MPTVTPGAIVPAVPYPAPVPPPVGLGVSRVSVSIDAAWLPYVIGCCKVLTANSTFDPPDPGPALAAIKSAYNLLDDLAAAQPCTSDIPGGCDCGCEDCMQLRFNGCTLQVFDCVTQEWVDVPTVGICVTNPSPGGGTTPPGPAKCQDYQIQFPANGLTVLPFLVNTGDVLTINTLKGAGSDGTPTWFCPDGSIFFGGACVGGSFTSSGDPINTAPHMSILVKIGSSYHSFYSTAPFTVPSSVTNQQIFIGVNDATISDDAGTYSIDFNYCNNQTPPTTTWRAKINFALNSGGFTPRSGFTGTPGSWVSGSGWQNSLWSTSGLFIEGALIDLAFSSPTALTSMTMKTQIVPGSSTAGSSNMVLGADAGSCGTLTNVITFSGLVSGENDVTGTFTCTSNKITLQAYASECGTSGGCGGTVNISELDLTGTGTPPSELVPFLY